MKTKIYSMLALMLLIAAPGFAQFTEDALRFSSTGRGVGSRALGMGNAYIGVSDDFSATYWNPAGLAQMRRIEITGGVTNFNYKNSAAFLGSTTDGKQSSTKLDNIGMAFPFPTYQGSFVVSFGYNRAADYTTTTSFDGFNTNSSIIPSLIEYDVTQSGYDIPFQTYLENKNFYTPITKNVQQTGTVTETGGLGNYAFAAAMDVAKDISFGVTLNLMRGSYKYERNYVETDVRNVYNNSQTSLPADSAYLSFNKFYYDNVINSDISGTNFVFGMMYRADRYRVGITIKTPTTVSISETYSNTGQSVFDPGSWAAKYGSSYSYDATNDYGVKSPWTFGAGVSVEPLLGLLVAGDVDYADWSQLEWTDNKSLEADNNGLHKDLQAVMNIRVGAEYEIPGTDLRIRAGYMHEPSKYVTDPTSWYDNTYTGGAGILLQNNVLVDLGVALGSFKTYHSNYIDSLLKAASRTDESIKTTRVNFTISYRF